MPDQFPDQISPISFARNGKAIQQTLSLQPFERAVSMLLNEHGALEVNLQFNTDESGIPVLNGSLQAQVQLPCQRCMEAMEVSLDSEFNMALIQDEAEEETLPEQYEPLLVDEKQFSLKDFIEDELILAIPVVVSHEAHACSASQYLQDETELEEQERENPFQILEQLKH